MRICVVGAGAIGGLIAARLALVGNAVMALTSRGPLDELTIEECGATCIAGLTRFQGFAEVLVIAVKAPALPIAAPNAAPMIGPETLIVPMLNGVPWWFVDGEPLRSVDPTGSIASALPMDQIVGCVVHASCSRPVSDHIIVQHADKLIIGEPNAAASERLERLLALLDDAALHPEITHDIRREIWYKLWGNATMNPLSALTRSTSDKIIVDPECRAWLFEGMAELALLGRAIGCPISESAEDRLKVAARLGAFKTSMLQDVEAGRSIELEALLGAPREIARQCRIATPALDRLYSLTKLMAASLGL